MGKLSIEYFGMMKVKLNLHNEEVSFPSDTITVAELIDLLCEKHGQAFADYIKQGYQIYIERDGHSQSILNLEKFDTILKDGDKVLFLYIFAGG